MILNPRLFVVVVAALFVAQNVCFADAESIQARISGAEKLDWKIKPQCTYVINAEWRKALQDRAGESPRQAAFEGSIDNHRSVLERQPFIAQQSINHEASRPQIVAGFTPYMPRVQSFINENRPDLRVWNHKCPPGAKCGVR